MSGGEKQMLTILPHLMGDPELVMIDEPTEGWRPSCAAGRRPHAEIARAASRFLLVSMKLSIAMRYFAPPLCHGPWRIVFRRHAGRNLSHEGSQEWLKFDALSTRAIGPWCTTSTCSPSLRAALVADSVIELALLREACSANRGRL